MTQSNNIIIDVLEKMLVDLADPQMMNNIRDDGRAQKIWQPLESSGLTLAWVPEALGGGGASLADGFDIIAVAGRFALATPLAETMLAGWLLSQASIISPSGAMSFGPVFPGERISRHEDGGLTGRVHHVPFAREAEHFAVLAEGPDGLSIALLRASECQVEERDNLAGEPRDTLVLKKARPEQVQPAPLGFDHSQLLQIGCVVRALQIAGALQSILARSIAYANERVAFGRKISQFQAIQHSLAKLAGEVAAAEAASTSAADTLANSASWNDESTILEVSAAKIRCAEAVHVATAIAHQVHGAIGFTEEHVLHRFTLRARAWRDDFGNESYWAAQLGRLISRGGASALWPLLASR